MNPTYFIEIDDEDVWEMAPTFLGNRERDVAALRTALEAGDSSTIQRLGHNMKGAGAAYGFPEITTLGAALESAARAADVSAAQDLTTQLADYLARVEVVPAFTPEDDFVSPADLSSLRAA